VQKNIEVNVTDLSNGAAISLAKVALKTKIKVSLQLVIW